MIIQLHFDDLHVVSIIKMSISKWLMTYTVLLFMWCSNAATNNYNGRLFTSRFSTANHNIQETRFIAFTLIWISNVHENRRKQDFGLFHQTIVAMKDMSGAKQSRFMYYIVFLGYNLYRNFLMTIILMIFGCHFNNIG